MSDRMNDRELLELAAKAAGIPIRIYPGMVVAQGTDCVCVDANGFKWNPLTDDGDALRLAVKLGAEVTVDQKMGRTLIDIESGMVLVKEMHESDPYAATRRAIVYAAAIIGAPPQSF